MEIVRAQPFFSGKSLILRDQLIEYVQGFPATKAHRQMISKAYNLKPGELGEEDELKKPTPKTKKSVTDTKENGEGQNDD